ncbi:LOW QUALITY PROTEIN: hypothetical protein U9M48_010794 [Paspalum notatum var. saurae]|uniref:Uncharacterized protein n=1 Tax=Paspalum notatum var. saurae TaxID=547442 RepID=A0AAQ3WGM4_PASNO
MRRLGGSLREAGGDIGLEAEEDTRGGGDDDNARSGDEEDDALLRRQRRRPCGGGSDRRHEERRSVTRKGRIDLALEERGAERYVARKTKMRAHRSSAPPVIGSRGGRGPGAEELFNPPSPSLLSPSPPHPTGPGASEGDGCRLVFGDAVPTTNPSFSWRLVLSRRPSRTRNLSGKS